MIWQVEWWVLWLSTARCPLTPFFLFFSFSFFFSFFHPFNAFSCTVLGKVAFLRIGLLVATFSTSDSSVVLAEVLQRLEVPAWCVLQPGPSQVRGTWAEEWWEAGVGHLLGCYQLGMDAVSWLDSCQPEAVVILGNSRWGQWTSGTPHILNLYLSLLKWT